jgi:hypothetical protein
LDTHLISATPGKIKKPKKYFLLESGQEKHILATPVIERSNEFELVDRIADLAQDYQNRIDNSKDEMNTDDFCN